MTPAPINAMTNAVELRDYIERILEEREKALILTAKSLNDRLEHLNALREDVLRDRAQFVLTEVWKENHTAITHRLDKLEKWQSWVLGFCAAVILLSGLTWAIVAWSFKGP